MRYVMEVTVFLMLIAVPAFVLVTLILVLAPLVFGDSIPQHDEASGQDSRIEQSVRAEAPHPAPRYREIWTRIGYDGNTTVTRLD